MKLKIVGATIFLTSLISNGVFSQNSNEEQQIVKEVEMKEENGEKILTIKTKLTGQETEEVYRGEAADKKLAELQNGQMDDEIKEEIQVEDLNGEIRLTITRTQNGNTTTEVLTGEDAENGLKEMRLTSPKTKQPTNKKVVEEKKVEINHD
ncbi:MAG: hypothetical protein ACK46O_10705 [Flavobacteriia bacterium]